MTLSSSLLTFLPQSDGYLPYFLLFVRLNKNPILTMH